MSLSSLSSLDGSSFLYLWPPHFTYQVCSLESHHDYLFLTPNPLINLLGNVLSKECRKTFQSLAVRQNQSPTSPLLKPVLNAPIQCHKIQRQRSWTLDLRDCFDHGNSSLKGKANKRCVSNAIYFVSEISYLYCWCHVFWLVSSQVSCASSHTNHSCWVCCRIYLFIYFFSIFSNYNLHCSVTWLQHCFSIRGHTKLTLYTKKARCKASSGIIIHYLCVAQNLYEINL